jgi:hypothetical protein
MIPTEEELIKFVKSKKFVNFSLIARHFNIKNTTVSDLVKDLEEKKLIEVINAGGSKMIQTKEDKIKKRGQVTVYIILGLVVLIALVAIFSLRNYIIKNEFEREQEKIQVVEEFKPVKNYLDSCIQSIALQGSDLMGLQGGYINIPEDNLPVNPVIPFSNKLDIFGNSRLVVPYWFYETANGIQKQQVPTLQEMQIQLADYINSNLNNCLNNFTAFEGYQINDFRSLSTSVEIGDNQIFVRMLTNIVINYKDSQADFDKFLVSVNSPLGKLYKTGKDILNKENSDSFFEQKTIDMLVLYDQVPYSGASLTCSPRTWFVENVKKDLKTIIRANIEAMNPSNQGYFNFDVDTNNADVKFKYNEQWPLDLSINGGEQVLKEESVFGQNNLAAAFLSTLFCLNNYHFVYDIKYPLLITLNEGDYFFQYATQVIIKNNQPKENKLGTNYLGNLDSRVCNSPSVKSSIRVRDSDTGANIENAKVEFSCVGSVCDLGNTGKDGLTILVPACLNAQISVSKDGYHDSSVTLDTIEESLFNLDLKPYKNKQVEVKVIDVNAIRNANSDESVMFTLTNDEDNYNLLINNEINSSNFLPARYHVQSFIIKNYPNGLKLDKQTIEYCTDIPKASVLGLIGLTERKCFSTDLETTELNKVIVGGADFDWEVTKEQLDNANKIVFYSMFNGVPANTQDLTKMYQKILSNADSNNFRMPLIK